jgi:hypothetical protein
LVLRTHLYSTPADDIKKIIAIRQLFIMGYATLVFFLLMLLQFLLYFSNAAHGLISVAYSFYGLSL